LGSTIRDNELGSIIGNELGRIIRNDDLGKKQKEISTTLEPRAS
jgi:hypothetical protein